MKKQYTNYMLEQLKAILNIPSPSGYSCEIQNYLAAEVKKLGYTPCFYNRPGLYIDCGGEGNPLMITAHADEIGLCVKSINSNGTLSVMNIGGLLAPSVWFDNVTIISRSGKKYSGTVNKTASSVHISNRESYLAQPDYEKNIEVVLDEDVKSKEDVKKLGICNGDFVRVDSNAVFCENGYIKSRFLDDKASVAAVLAVMKAIKEEKIILNRKILVRFSLFEEVGYGSNYGLPFDLIEMLAVDIGCVGGYTDCDEKKVAIIAKDSTMYYSADITSRLISLANENNISCTIDVLTNYGSDATKIIENGWDVKCSLIGPGVRSTHGYERTHEDALTATADLILAYLRL